MNYEEFFAWEKDFKEKMKRKGYEEGIIKSLIADLHMLKNTRLIEEVVYYMKDGKS